MYKDYFRLRDLPFSISPDPAYLYMSSQHREALAHLVYGVKSDSAFVLLTGEVGTGKTTVCRCMLEQLADNYDTAFILNPKLTEEELLASICEEIRIQYPIEAPTVKNLVDRINHHLLDSHAAGRRTLLIIDEAQNLSPSVLEQLRLLTNLETNRCKLLQIILIGQPELRKMLDKPELRQLSQRITARFHLDPLSKNDISHYVGHRLAVAGARRQLFTPAGMKKLYVLSGGVPRLINLICDRALLGTYSQGRTRVNKRTLNKAAREVLGRKRPGLQLRHRLGRFSSWLRRRLTLAPH
ncbi:MAG TPA: AAA family ATPase [Dissulfurispiraceae bacterium]|nr:AAA family ATPase [Dissulfurispiraceae bacterium]